MTVDLRSRYLGIELKHPVIVGACPLSAKPDMLRRLADAGAAAVVFPSLFEEQIEHDELALGQVRDMGSDSFPEAMNYFPALDRYNVGADRYLEQLEQARRAVDIPIIGSLNGVTRGGWTRYAKRIQDAGATALELNVALIAADPADTAASVEARYVDLVAEVRQAITIPLTVKIGPHFTALTHFVKRLTTTGIDGLTLFNRIVHPDIDLESLRLVTDLPLSRSADIRLPLAWIAILREHVTISLAAATGAHTWQDVLKAVLVGADAVMLVSRLYEAGPGELGRVINGVSTWLSERGYQSVAQMKGSMARHNCHEPDGFERVNYMRTLTSFGGPTLD